MEGQWSWNDELETGVEKIDNQHKELIEKINRLIFELKEGEKEKGIEETIKFLEVYIVEHFSDEEKLQQEIGYPGYADHKETHEAFIQDIKALRQQMLKEGITLDVSLNLSRTVNQWLVEHINSADRDIAEYIKSKG